MSPTVQLYHQNIMDVIVLLAKMGNKTIEYWFFRATYSSRILTWLINSWHITSHKLLPLHIYSFIYYVPLGNYLSKFYNSQAFLGQTMRILYEKALFKLDQYSLKTYAVKIKSEIIYFLFLLEIISINTTSKCLGWTKSP